MMIIMLSDLSDDDMPELGTLNLWRRVTSNRLTRRHRVRRQCMSWVLKKKVCGIGALCIPLREKDHIGAQ